MDMSVVLMVSGSISRFRVITESQPAEFSMVFSYVPPAVYVESFHTNGSSLPQMVMSVVLMVSGSISRFRVITESQPAAFSMVFLYVPPTVYVESFHTNGSSLPQMDMSVVLMVSGSISRFRVITESQPAAFSMVFSYVPPAVYVESFHTNGSSLPQMVMSVVLMVSGSISRFRVITESQPAAFSMVFSYVPPAVYVESFHTNGSSLPQIDMSVVLMVSGSISRFRVITESQPAEFSMVFSYVPPAVYVESFHTNGSSLPQMVMSVVLMVSGSISRFRVITESQPAAFSMVFLYVPPTVYVESFHTNGSSLPQMDMSVVLMVSGSISRFRVITESQPAEFSMVFSYVPPAVYVESFHTNGSSLPQMVMSVVLMVSGSISRFRVITESQPAAFSMVFLYVPPTVYVESFHTNGSSLPQMDMSVVLMVSGSISRFRVITESQPAAFSMVFSYVPPAVYVESFHTNGSSLPQMDMSVVLMVSGSI